MLHITFIIDHVGILTNTNVKGSPLWVFCCHSLSWIYLGFELLVRKTKQPEDITLRRLLDSKNKYQLSYIWCFSWGMWPLPGPVWWRGSVAVLLGVFGVFPFAPYGKVQGNLTQKSCKGITILNDLYSDSLHFILWHRLAYFRPRIITDEPNSEG